MTVARIMKDKVGAVITAAPGESVQSVAGRLARHGIGAVVVVDAAGKIAGMVLESDVVRTVSEERASATTARDVMSPCKFACSPDSSESELLEIMCREHIRHLPVVSEGRLTGIVSLGDVVRLRLQKIQEVMSEIERTADEQRFTATLLGKRSTVRALAMAG